MKLGTVLTTVLVCMVICSAPGAKHFETHKAALGQSGLAEELGHPTPTWSREDTVWFGNESSPGIAAVNSVWDFETPGSNGFQGCISWDAKANPGIYFGRVTASDFTSHGDPCIPMIGGSTGMLWCGIHQDEADARDFISGMGYQNDMCQRAFSPEFAIDPLTDDVDLAFDYFNHTEPGYDYTYVYVLCYDAIGDVIEEYAVATFDAEIGSADLPAFFDEGVEVPAGALPAETVSIQVEFRMDADGNTSDEDGLWDSPCGPFGVDNIDVAIGGSAEFYDFETDAEGWTFERCASPGAHMHIVHDYEYEAWLDDLGLTCDCTLVGDAVAFVSTTCQNGPGLVPGLKEQFETAVIPRAGYPAPYWNSVVVKYDGFLNMPNSTGAHYRPGWRKYPFTTEVNPVPHWSKRNGQNVWYYTSSPACGEITRNLSTMADGPLPVEWDSLKFIYEVYVSCDGFGTPPSVCVDEGCTGGSPVIDNIRVGITNAADAPPISWVDGGLYQDGFGQNYPTYLEPSDRCNANISYDVSRDNTEQNDWLGDSSAVVGPLVSSEAGRWLCEFCFQLSRLGARQQMIPEYQEWKARLDGDPEQDFVCVLIDSLQTNNNTQVWRNKFATYFHEDDPAYRGPGDYNAQNEVLPDQVFVPGTRIDYYWRSFWFNGGAPPQDYYLLGFNPLREVEFLPMMEVASGEEYTVQWPSVLYVDAFNRGAEDFMLPALEQLGIDFDKYDYADASSNWNASMKRSLGGTVYNPGGYGNNGCTTEQLLGYRLVILNSGTFGQGAMEEPDFELFDQWLSTTDCGLADIRRGLVLDGDEICEIMADDVHGLAINFAHNVLGTTLEAIAYRDFNNDPAYCVRVEPVETALFTPADPGISLYGNGCPQEFDYNVLGVQPGVTGVTGNLDFWSYELTGDDEYVDFAQVVRVNEEPGVANWRSAVNGFSFHHLSEPSCLGEPCSNDSTCRVEGTSNLYGPLLEWMEEGATPFQKWLYPCFSTGVEQEENHFSGPINYLHQSRPNPFHARATVRFSMASQGHVELSVFDVSGRLVRTLLDGEAQAGENSVVWDGTDNQGRRVSGGIFWMQMTTHDGFQSGKKLLVMR